MREIKFRAWDGKLMHHVDTLIFPVGGIKWMGPGVGQGICNANPGYSWKEDSILMQYTGLKDKYGVEIYEGDIFNHKHDKASPDGGYISGTMGFHPETAEVVSFSDGCFFSGNDYLHNRLFWYKRHNWQLIGNIYENPELLK